MPTKPNCVVSPEFLMTCHNWQGSSEQYLHNHCGGLLRSHVATKVRQLRACDDRTERENEYLAALEKTLAANP